MTCTQHGCTPLHHQSSSSCRYSSKGDSVPQTGRLDTARGLRCVLRPCGEPWHGMEALRADQPHTPPQPLAVPPSIQTSSLWSCSPGHPVLLFPVPIQMLAAAKWHLQPPKASAKGVTQPGPGACGQWARWEPGQARERYSQACPGCAGTARFYHNIQVFPLPALSLAVKTELEHKHSNLQQEKNKKKARERSSEEHCSTPLPAIAIGPAAAPSSPPGRSPCLFRYPGKHFVLR